MSYLLVPPAASILIWMILSRILSVMSNMQNEQVPPVVSSSWERAQSAASTLTGKSNKELVMCEFHGIVIQSRKNNIENTMTLEILYIYLQGFDSSPINYLYVYNI